MTMMIMMMVTAVTKIRALDNKYFTERNFELPVSPSASESSQRANLFCTAIWSS